VFRRKPTTVQFKVADFDGARYHISTSEDKSELSVSFVSGCAEALLEKGGKAHLQSVYGSAFVAPEDGYSVTLKYKADNIQDKEKLASLVAQLKTHLYGAPLLKALTDSDSGSPSSQIIDIPLRNSTERIWIKSDPSEKRVTVIFSVAFSDADDVVFGKVFLQEFKKSLPDAPSVDFRFDIPGELTGVPNLPQSTNVGYVTFVLFDRHIAGPKKIKVAEFLPSFRNYLQYHIKCAKSHLHTRMRNRVEESIKILNRAKQDDDSSKEKKTATGKTFKRQ